MSLGGRKTRYERRENERQILVRRAAKLITPQGERLGLVHDVSPSGAMAEAPGAYRAGEAITIAFKAGGPIHGRIAWAEGGRIGIVFDQRVDLHDVLIADALLSNRPLRFAVRATASLCLGSRFQRVAIDNISFGGMRIALDGEDHAGRKVVVALDDLPAISGIISWHRHGSAGIAFDVRLEFNALALWLAGRP